jgi:glucose-6-phosphate isomerase
MSYVHLIGSCFSEALGVHGLDQGRYELLLRGAGDAVQALRARHADGSLPLLHLPAARDDLAVLAPLVARYRASFDDVILLGAGGSSLGGQTLCNLAVPGEGPRMHFFDNVDPYSLDALLAAVDLPRTGFLIVSKSGSTVETMAVFLICLEAMLGAVGAEAAGDHFTAITEPADNVLRRICEAHGIAVLDHDPGIGGRYSVLSLVGLLPAMIAGLDAVAVREGATEVLAEMLAENFDGASTDLIAPAIGAAIAVGLERENRISTTVLMPYVDRLADFGLWFRQLWAESLGKDGKGTTPINALGAVDQHSQLQLYLDGPRDKMFTVIMLDIAGKGPVVSPALANDDALSYLAGHTLGDLMDAEQRATAQTLIKHNRPTRIIRIDALDERVMGALFMHFMLETIIAAHMMEVDPFDQPAVEDGKNLARQYLAAPRDLAESS